MGVVRAVGRVLLDITVLLLVLVLLPGLPPDVKYTYYETEETLPFDGPLAKNDILNDAGRILDGKINGPESIASRDRYELFTSLHNGKILRVWGKNFDHFQVITTIGPGCEGPWQESVCGRPLGLRFAPDGKLIVVDAYLGLFALDVETGKKESLFDIKQEIDGAVPKIPDDLDIDEDGNIYWSDASSVVDLSNGIVEMLSDPSGRLIKFDSKTKTNSVLLKNVHFANGVQLSPDRDFVLVCETFRSRVLRHWLNGPNAGKTDVFVDRLPGKPDNLRAKKGGGYYVSLVAVDNKEKIDLTRVLAKLPLVRKLILRLFGIPKFLFDTISKVYPNQFTENASYKIYHLQPIAEIIASQSTVIVELDAEGKIVSSLQGDNGNVRFISETHQVGDYLFFGSPYNNYLGYLRVDYTDEDEEEELTPSLEVDGEGVKMSVGASEKVEDVDEEKEVKEEPQEVVEEQKVLDEPIPDQQVVKEGEGQESDDEKEEAVSVEEGIKGAEKQDAEIYSEKDNEKEETIVGEDDDDDDGEDDHEDDDKKITEDEEIEKHAQEEPVLEKTEAIVEEDISSQVSSKKEDVESSPTSPVKEEL
ncbi:adipocyte plasma membrane-associated protein-like [Palaemon carinicauda]|uniref:adipocyte plasma membrane-associated protein-like n=1 Tax=Palaemon carinicauda TaxID=392227 RepID=UPI0035B5EABE